MELILALIIPLLVILGMVGFGWLMVWIDELIMGKGYPHDCGPTCLLILPFYVMLAFITYQMLTR